MKTWVRYAVPLTIVSLVAMLPFVWIALRVPVPADLAAARLDLKLGWAMAATAWLFQLWLVGAAAPLAGNPAMSQARALTAAFVGLGRAAIPVAIAATMVLVGSIALVIPGVVLLVMLALTGATEGPLPQPLVASIAIARQHWKRLAVIIAAMVVADLAIAAITHALVVPKLPAKAPGAMIAPVRGFVRIVAGVLVVGSAVPATILAELAAKLRT